MYAFLDYLELFNGCSIIVLWLFYNCFMVVLYWSHNGVWTRHAHVADFKSTWHAPWTWGFFYWRRPQFVKILVKGSMKRRAAHALKRTAAHVLERAAVDQRAAPSCCAGPKDFFPTKAQWSEHAVSDKALLLNFLSVTDHLSTCALSLRWADACFFRKRSVDTCEHLKRAIVYAIPAGGCHVVCVTSRCMAYAALRPSLLDAEHALPPTFVQAIRIHMAHLSFHIWSCHTHAYLVEKRRQR